MSPVKEVDIIKKARELISDPKRWTKGAGARDKHGDPVPITNPGAVCWCVSGALVHVAGFSDGYDAEKLLLPGGGGITGFNDTHEHAEVLELMDKAIARLEAK
jgi:hypothetical protein